MMTTLTPAVLLSYLRQASYINLLVILINQDREISDLHFNYFRNKLIFIVLCTNSSSSKLKILNYHLPS